MSKVMINQEVLDDFTRTLDDIQFSIKVELSTNLDKGKVQVLLDSLLDAWAEVYDPIGIDLSRSIRKLYERYIQAKKAGDYEKANSYLTCYLDMKKG